MRPEPRVVERDGAPVSTDVCNAGDPTERGVLERKPRAAIAPHLLDIGHGGGLLVEEEDFAQDFRWDAAGGRKRVAASADCAQRTTDGSHLAIDEVECRGIGEGGGRNLSYHVVDKRNARLNGVGPVFGGPG